ncbi:MAG: hypothetical protein M3Y22_10315, partial [Pseudomonadota bacterium]|nr:hypothetical protein [Pseudomonadota bacterium]
HGLRTALRGVPDGDVDGDMRPMRLLARLLRRAGVPVSGSRRAPGDGQATAAVQSPVHWRTGAAAVP